MKAIVTFAVAAMLAASVAGQDTAAEENTVRRSWFHHKGYLSEDQATFRECAKDALVDLEKEIDRVALKAGSAAPVYFKTRLQSLRQQQLHLSAKLAELDSDAIKARQSGPRYAFDHSLGSLEEALDQATEEAESLAKVNSPAHR